jgi:ribonuclease HI
MSKALKINIDGSYNPQRMSCACIATINGIEVFKFKAKCKYKISNSSIAEMFGLKLALDKLIEIGYHKINKEIWICSDYEPMIELLKSNGKWSKRCRYRAASNELLGVCKNLLKRFTNLSLVIIKRDCNEEADKLAALVK